MTADYWRQLDLVRPADFTFPITIIGTGGIGSPVALALVKMGCRRLTLYDPDVVEPHNLPNQMYRLRDIGRPKVEALAEVLTEYAEVDVTPIQARVEAQPLAGIAVSAVDSMASRMSIWGSIRFQPRVPLYIDARMGGEVGRVLAVRPVDPDDVRGYEATLFADAAANEDPCTAQAIIYNTLAIAAVVARHVKRFVRGEAIEADVIFDLATLTLLSETSEGYP